MKKKKRKEDYFLRNKHVSDRHCKNKPSYTGIIYTMLLASSSAILVKQLLSAYSPQILGIHKIQRTKHTVIRKLKFIIQAAVNQRVLKTTAVEKEDFKNMAPSVSVLSFASTIQGANC